MSPKLCEPISPAETAEPRNSRGPLAQLLRDAAECDRSGVTVYCGGFEVGDKGQLWHADCPVPTVGRSTAREVFA